MYYESRIKAKVEEEIKATNVQQGQYISIVSKNLKEFYALESADIKKAMRALREKHQKEKEDEQEHIFLLRRGPKIERTAEEYTA